VVLLMLLPLSLLDGVLTCLVQDTAKTARAAILSNFFLCLFFCCKIAATPVVKRMNMFEMVKESAEPA